MHLSLHTALYSKPMSAGENALAEKVNGILKDGFYFDQNLTDEAQAAIKNPIKLYNEIRLHLSLDIRTPNMVYKLTA